ncbi:MAG: hypothetical protein ACLFM7_14400 [Bacteroidales bacterium]
MERYLKQLINDMRESARHVPDEDLSVFFGNDDDDNLPVSETYQHGPKRKLSEIVGIPSMCFPPENQLHVRQIEILAVEMELLLNAYYFFPDFPKGLPARLRYQQLTRIWDDEHVFLTNGENHLEFCDYDESNCPFPGYCDICSQIKKYRDNDEDEDLSDMKYDPSFDLDNWEDMEEKAHPGRFNPQLTNSFIPSIYNYCDGWCERCLFRKRCRYYYNDKTIFGREAYHLTKKEFLKSIRHILEKTRFFLEREIRKRGIELKDTDNASYKQIQNKIKNHPLVKAGKKYSLRVSQWLFDHRDYIQQKLDRQRITHRKQQLFEDIELIHWDHTIIPAKISKAIHGLINEGEICVVEDANGSAKVALILADRSLKAWQELLEAFHEKEDEIFKIINQLKNLRNDILEDFPNAPKFHRPGFDD